MKKVILPTDFSDNAKNAIHYALQLLKDHECNFYLLNTYTPVIYNYDYQMNTGGYMGDVVDVVKNSSENMLDELKTEITTNFSNKKHHFHTVSSFNLLTDEIKYQIDENDMDLVIMGTKGANGAREVLFGSNAIHVINKAHCPVLMIPDGYSFEKPVNILFPTDYKVHCNEKHLRILKWIADPHQSNIHILNISHGNELTVEENANKHCLEEILSENNHHFYRVADQQIPKAIQEFQNGTDIQLLMMINNKHSFFENLFFKPVIHQIGFHLTVPFLVVPSKL